MELTEAQTKKCEDALKYVQEFVKDNPETQERFLGIAACDNGPVTIITDSVFEPFNSRHRRDYSSNKIKFLRGNVCLLEDYECVYERRSIVWADFKENPDMIAPPPGETFDWQAQIF